MEFNVKEKRWQLLFPCDRFRSVVCSFATSMQLRETTWTGCGTKWHRNGDTCFQAHDRSENDAKQYTEAVSMCL